MVMRQAKLRMGEVKVEDLDENGMIRNEGRWDFKKTLNELERKVKKSRCRSNTTLDPRSNSSLKTRSISRHGTGKKLVVGRKRGRD